VGRSPYKKNRGSEKIRKNKNQQGLLKMQARATSHRAKKEDMWAKKNWRENFKERNGGKKKRVIDLPTASIVKQLVVRLERDGRRRNFGRRCKD